MQHSNRPPTGSAQPLQTSEIDMKQYLARQYDNALTAKDLECKLRFQPDYKPPLLKHYQFWTLQMVYQKILSTAAPTCQASKTKEPEETRSELALRSKLCKALWDDYHFFLPMQTVKKVIDLMLSSFQALRKGSILPILDPSRFLTMQGRHSAARLVPALWLASKFLSSPKSLEFLHALMFGKRTSDSQSAANGTSIVRFWRVYEGTSLPAQEVEKVHNVLADISANIDYKFLPIQSKNGKLAGNCCIGKTTQADGALKMKFHIAIHEEKYEALGDLTGTEADILQAWFDLAAILIHELAHAVGIHVAVKRKLASIRDPIFEDGKAFDAMNPGELGHALERQLFGTDWADVGVSLEDKMFYFKELLQ